MDQVAVIIFWILLVAAAIQAVAGGYFAAVLLSLPRPAPVEARWPKTAILLSLRGADPQLAASLERLLQQDYPDYALYVVVDNDRDPAWAVVESAARQHSGKLYLSALMTRRTNCGLQCSSLVQAASKLPPDAEVVVTIDGDLMPHPSWLRELVQPLLDDRVGASFGNRWFMPQRSNWGSLVRYLWNVAAVIPMHLFSIPWGGCLAVRRSAFDAAQLVECWSESIVHDAPIKSRLNQLGLRVEFVPSLMMVLRETCSLSFSRDFLKRQLTWTRLYHPHWSPILLHATATTGIWVVAAALAIGGLFAANSRVFAFSAGGLATYWVTMLVLITLLESAVRRVLHRRAEATRWMTGQTLGRLALAIPLTQLVHFVAVLEATVRRRVMWRGVTYLLHGPHDVRLIEERPFEQPTDPLQSHASL